MVSHYVTMYLHSIAIFDSLMYCIVLHCTQYVCCTHNNFVQASQIKPQLPSSIPFNTYYYIPEQNCTWSCCES